MKIVSLEAENFKRLKAIEIKPTGSTVVITGKNAQGKSSILDSIFAAVGGAGAVPSKPIRKGEQSAHIKLDLGEVIVTRKFTAAGSTLSVEQANGARFSKPQQMLDQLIGSIAFDPLEFTRMKPTDQFETLRKLVPLEVDIDALDGQSRSDYEARTGVNRDAKSLRAQAAGIMVAPDLPAQPIDTAALLTQMQEAGEANAEIERRKAKREQAARDVEVMANEARGHRARAIAFRKQAEEADAEASAIETKEMDLRGKIENAEALPAPIDVTAIRATVEQADKTNARIADRNRRQEIEAKAAEKEAQSQKLTDAIEARATAKADAIRAAKMPIEGLSFGEGEVLYSDLPLDQASQAERIRVSMAVAMALNPKLRVLTIKDGSLIDEEGLKIISEMVESNDFQLFIEKVSTDGSIGILIEDGSIVPQAEKQGAMPLDAA
jgi:predicted ATP-dependent endonuclease of OLD family